MRTPDKYRYTLQWGAETSEKVQAGDFLESLGNHKSEFIVLAINEYLDAHPESLLTEGKLQIVVKPSVTPEQVKAMIAEMLEEKMSELSPAIQDADTIGDKLTALEEDVDEMLKNLDLFSQ